MNSLEPSDLSDIMNFNSALCFQKMQARNEIMSKLPELMTQMITIVMNKILGNTLIKEDLLTNIAQAPQKCNDVPKK